MEYLESMKKERGPGWSAGPEGSRSGHAWCCARCCTIRAHGTAHALSQRRGADRNQCSEV